MKQHWVRLQLRFQAANAIVPGGLKWQYITIIAIFSSSIVFYHFCVCQPPTNEYYYQHTVTHEYAINSYFIYLFIIKSYTQYKKAKNFFLNYIVAK